MDDKDVALSRRRGSWKSRLSLALVAIVVLSASAAVRYFWATRSASAQSPARPSGAQAPGPARRPAAGSRSPVTASAGATAPPAAAAASGPPPKVVAAVNGEQITRDQLARE